MFYNCKNSVPSLISHLISFVLISCYPSAKVNFLAQVEDKERFTNVRTSFRLASWPGCLLPSEVRGEPVTLPFGE